MREQKQGSGIRQFRIVEKERAGSEKEKETEERIESAEVVLDKTEEPVKKDWQLPISNFEEGGGIKKIDLSQFAEQIEQIVKNAKKETNWEKRKKILPSWSDANRLNSAVNSLRELLE